MKLRITLLSVACATLSMTAFADTGDIKASNNQVGMQETLTKVDYTETGNGVLGSPGTLDTETGNISGIALSLSAMNDWWLGNDYIQLGYSRSEGDTNYVGASLIGGGAYGSVVAQDGATIEDYHFRYGKGFAVGSQGMLTPYFEIGRH